MTQFKHGKLLFKRSEVFCNAFFLFSFCLQNGAVVELLSSQFVIGVVIFIVVVVVVTVRVIIVVIIVIVIIIVVVAAVAAVCVTLCGYINVFIAFRIQATLPTRLGEVIHPSLLR